MIDMGYFVGKVAPGEINASAESMVGLTMIISGDQVQNIVIQKNLNQIFSFSSKQWVELSHVQCFSHFTDAYLYASQLSAELKNETSNQ